jgi:site-specific DNA recombinase
VRHCQFKGYDLRYRFSEAFSGLALERPKLNELRELMRSGQIDVLVVYCLDRLSRDPTHGVILMQELEKCHVTLEAVTETVDSSELGKLISYIRGFASKLEAEKIRERTLRGKRAKLMRGELPQGTGVGMYGYDWNNTTKRREVNQAEAEIVRHIFARVAAGDSLVSIARRLNERAIRTKGTKTSEEKRRLWHSLTIRRMVRNSGYTGSTRFGDTVLSNVTPAIVAGDIFYAANAQLDRPKVRTGRPKHEYLLRNHAFCAI